MIAAGFLALLGSFMVTAPAQAGYYGNSYYGYNPCSYRPRCGGYRRELAISVGEHPGMVPTG